MYINLMENEIDDESKEKITINVRIDENMASDKVFDKKDLEQELCQYLELNTVSVISTSSFEIVKEMCVAKLCQVIGIRCAYNYKRDFFKSFSIIMGVCVAMELELDFSQAPLYLGLIKIDGVNYVNTVLNMLTHEDRDSAFLDAFKLIKAKDSRLKSHLEELIKE